MKKTQKSAKEHYNKNKIEKTKKISIIEGSFWSVMDGFGQRYITPYALWLGASNFIIGLLASFPQLLGNLSQLYTLKLMKKYKRKKIALFSVFTQAFLFFPIIFIGFLYFYFKISSNLAANLLVLFYSLMIAAGSLQTPAWNSWMKDVVKENSGEYFGKRSRIMGIIGIFSMLFAGIIINFFGKENFIGFFIIFLIAFIGRFCSGILLKKQYEPKFKFEESYYFSFLQFSKKMFYNNFGRFVIFISLISFATAIAAPFFAVYMLKNLNFSYIEFTLISLIGPISIITFVSSWGKFADIYGNFRVLKITGKIIPFIPLLWIGTLPLISYNSKPLLIFYLILVEITSGFAWSGFNLSSVNFIYDAVTRQRMAICVTYYNLLIAISTFFGSLLGGFLASQEHILGFNSIIFIFFLSGILRFSLYSISIKNIREVKKVKNIDINKKLKAKIKNYLGIFIKGINELKY